MKRWLTTGVFFIAGLFFSCAGERYDYVLKDGWILDGTGTPWYRADIGIKGGMIEEIGLIPAEKGKQVIEIAEKIISPGFIDMHTHAEDEILDNREAANFARQGVTTVVGGNCGGSPLELRDFFDNVEREGTGLNIAVLAGHGSIRSEVLGSEDREPTAEELNEMKDILRRAMEEGAVGLSSGLKYTPGAYAETDEVIELAKVAAELGGFYATHMREEGHGVIEAVKEAIEIGERAGIPVQISHHKVISVDRWGDSRETLRLIDEARARGVDVKMDQYPYPASSTGLTVLFPSWSMEGGGKKLRERLDDPETRARIAKEVEYNIVHDRGGSDLRNIMIASCGHDSTIEGKNIRDILEMRGKEVSMKNGVAEIMDIVYKGGASAIYMCMSDEDIERIMRHPATMHASDASIAFFGEGFPHPRNYGTFPRVLARYVREKKIISMEDAIRKMTSLPASMGGFRDRGIIAEGMKADLVAFDPETVEDTATWDNPHQYPTGIPYVFVNGVAVVFEGEATGALPGEVLYGPGTACTSCE